MGPARLAAVLSRWPPDEAWRRVRDGRAHRDPAVAERLHRLDDGVVARWRHHAARVDVREAWERHRAEGVDVCAPGDPGFPAVLTADPEPPAVLFSVGDPAALDRARVAVVGTRRCTWSGRSLATELGTDLAAAGVCVVSGLALGIDGAAHRGALQSGGAPPVAVVGTGLDVVYPRRNADLWAAVAGAGAVLSEYPLGTRPEPWRFPARNRLVAALADVVVVVESHARGGSLHTVEAALERGVTVMAVPGPVRSSASAGTNGLLVAGSAPVRDAGDVLVALGLTAGARSRGEPSAGPRVDPAAARVLDALGQVPATLEQVAGRVGAPLATVAVELARLERDGVVAACGGWWQPIGAAPGPPSAREGSVR